LIATWNVFRSQFFSAKTTIWSCAIRFVLHNDAHRYSFLEAIYLTTVPTRVMTPPRPELPNDIPSCHDVIEQLHAELQLATNRIGHLEALLAEHKETIADQEQTIEKLAGDNTLLKRSLFGSRRERYTDDPAQALLFDAQTLDTPKPDPGDTKPPEPKKRTSKGRQPRVFPDFLPREAERFNLTDDDIPEPMRDNPNARRFFKKVGERLELIPMQLKIVEQFQEVIALDQPDETTQIVSAPRPTPLIKSFAGPSLWAYLTVSRFGDHLPYYRLENILGRGGVHIHRSTQWRWMRELALGVTPLVDLMWKRALQSKIVAMDETPVMELGGPGKTLTGYLWAGVGDADHPYDCFFYTSDRCASGPETFLSGFQGYLLTDAYIGYERIGELWPGVFKASCWAHGRRKFDECHHLGATDQTHTALAYFRQLFDIEDLYRSSSDEERLAGRREKSQPIVDAFHQWLEYEHARQLPKAKLRGAINYMLNRWDTFTRFLESGAIPMDNNGAERALKYPILGRKAWLFFGNYEAGVTAAKLFTLTKTCNRLHIDTFAYLQDVYARLPTTPLDDLASLLPDRWLAEHPEHVLPQRVQEAIDRAQRARERRAERRAAA
jgi:transposase